MTDNNVDIVIGKLRYRSSIGLSKYGVTTERGDLAFAEWLLHLQEELLDAAVYVQVLMSREESYGRTETTGNCDRSSNYHLSYS